MAKQQRQKTLFTFSHQQSETLSKDNESVQRAQLSQIINDLLKQNGWNADCRDLSADFGKKGAKISHSTLYAWKSKTQRISEGRKALLAKYLGKSIFELNVFLAGKCSLEDFKLGKCGEVSLPVETESDETPMSLQRIIHWIGAADPSELLTLQEHITKALQSYFCEDYTSLSQVLQYAITDLAKHFMTEKEVLELPADERQKRATQLAFADFAEDVGLEPERLKALIEENATPAEVEIIGIASTIDWQEEQVAKLVYGDKKSEPCKIKTHFEENGKELVRN